MRYGARTDLCRARLLLTVENVAEPIVVGVVVAPDDALADHAGLFFVGDVVGAVEREVAHCRELGLHGFNQNAFEGM
jgi:hypothetical protein